MTIFYLLIFLFPLAYSPGPGNLFFAAHGARCGWRNTLPANMGYHLATFIITFVIGIGFATIVTEYSFLLTIIGYIGSCYILYLASKLLRAGTVSEADIIQKIGFIDGVLLFLSNPKAYIIIVAMFSQFLEESSQLTNVLFIAIVFTINNFIAFIRWTIAGDVLLSKFRSDVYAKCLNIAFGIALALVSLWLIVQQIIS